MASISSLGVGSGLDAESLVTQLLAVERKPIDQLQARTTKLQTQLSAYGKLQSAVSAFRDAAAAMTRASTWSPTKASSSDATAVSATTGDASVPGSYRVVVDKLASAQSLVSRTWADSTATVGSGTLTIELGAWSADQSAFTPKAGATALSVSVAAGDTLADVRDRINAAGAGVVASIVNDATGARLSLRATDSGTANAFRVSAADDDGANGDAAGLSALAFDPSAGVGSMTQTLAASNAVASINGIAIDSTGNTLADVIDGLTITLTRAQPGVPVDVSVQQDGDAMRKSVEAFAKAYNDLVALVRDQTKYDAGTKAAGTLQGDRTAVGLQAQLRSLVGGESAASSAFARLADIGLDPQADGTLKINGSKLDAAIAKPAELKKFFAADDVLDANDGFGVRLRAWAAQQIDLEGPLTTRQEGLRASIDRNDDRKAEMETRIAQIEKRLRAQYTALDAQMAQLNGLSNYVTQQIKALTAKSE